MRNFRKLEIWQKGISVVKKVYSTTENLPDKEKFGLSSQMQRSAISIPSNIAEGCSRNSELEFKRFFEIALGSAFKLKTQLILRTEVGYLNNKTLSSFLSDLHQLQKQLNAIISTIIRSQRLTAKSQKPTI